jgi:hypothetical protein
VDTSSNSKLSFRCFCWRLEAVSVSTALATTNWTTP